MSEMFMREIDQKKYTKIMKKYNYFKDSQDYSRAKEDIFCLSESEDNVSEAMDIKAVISDQYIIKSTKTTSLLGDNFDTIIKECLLDI